MKTKIILLLMAVNNEIDKRILAELETFIGCPFCGHNEIQITTPFRKYILKEKGKIVSGNQYVYKCKKCEEGFTSTLSDTISFENFKTKKL